MERSENRTTWLIIIGLILVGGLASAVWPTISAQLDIGNAAELAAAEPEPEPIVFHIEDHLLGEEIMTLLSDAPQGVQEFVNNNINGREISYPMAIGIFTALAVGGLIALGLPLAFIYTRLESSASEIQEDEEYKAAVSTLENRQKEELKEKQQQSPARVEGDEAEDRRGFAYTMAFLYVIFAWVVGTVIGHAVYGEEVIVTEDGLVNPVSIVSLVVLIITLVGFFIYFRFIQKPEEIDPAETDYAPVSWGWIWVVVSGMLIVGVGTGLALNLISGGGAPPG